MSTAPLRIAPSGPPALFNGVPVEIGSGFMTRSAQAWGVGTADSILGPQDFSLYGTNQADPLIVMVDLPRPDLLYAFEANWFLNHLFNVQVTKRFEYSLDGGTIWIPFAQSSSIQTYFASATVIQNGGRVLGSALGVVPGTQSLKVRYRIEDNTSDYVLEPIRWVTLSEFLP